MDMEGVATVALAPITFPNSEGDVSEVPVSVACLDVSVASSEGSAGAAAGVGISGKPVVEAAGTSTEAGAGVTVGASVVRSGADAGVAVGASTGGSEAMTLSSSEPMCSMSAAICVAINAGEGGLKGLMKRNNEE